VPVVVDVDAVVVYVLPAALPNATPTPALAGMLLFGEPDDAAYPTPALSGKLLLLIGGLNHFINFLYNARTVI